MNTMETAAESVKRFAQAIEGLTSDLDTIFADQMLVCKVCGYQRPMQQGEGSYYTFNGWPKHCGKTMRVGKATPEVTADDHN